MATFNNSVTNRTVNSERIPFKKHHPLFSTICSFTFTFLVGVAALHSLPLSIKLWTILKCSLSSAKNISLPLESFWKFSLFTLSSPLADARIWIPRSLAFLDISKVRSHSGGSRAVHRKMNFSTSGSERPLR